MAALSDFNQLVRIFVPGAPDNAIEFAVRESARRFCSLSWFLRRSINVTLVDGTDTYTLTPADDEEEVIGVHAVDLNEQPLDSTRPELAPEESGTPKCFYFEPTDQLTLYPTPDDGVAGELLQVRIAVQPTLDATTIADELVREYRQCIAEGAVAWLMNVPKQPWSDPNMAMTLGRQVMAKTMRAKEAALRHHQPWGVYARRPVFAVR